MYLQYHYPNSELKHTQTHEKTRGYASSQHGDIMVV